MDNNNFMYSLFPCGPLCIMEKLIYIKGWKIKITIIISLIALSNLGDKAKPQTETQIVLKKNNLIFL